MKLKMWTGNLDGRREGLVIATSKTRARQIIQTGRDDFKNYWTEKPVDASLAAEVLYTRPLDARSADALEWKPLRSGVAA